VSLAKRMLAAGNTRVLSFLYAADTSMLNLLVTKKRLEHLARSYGNQSVIEFTNTIHYNDVVKLFASIGDMKFDVIVGNPPFKNRNEVGGKSSLWRKIVKRSYTHLSEGGYLTMVAPQFPNSANDLGDIFTTNQTEVVWTDISSHFPGIGSSFTAWIVSRTPKTAKTYFINQSMHIDVTSRPLPKDLRSISILDKVSSHPCFECMSSPEYLHTSVADGKDDDHLSSIPDPSRPYIIRRTSGENYQMYGAVRPTDYESPKVVMTFSGYPHYRYHGPDAPIGTIKFQSGYILVKDQDEGANLIALYESRLYRFIQDQLLVGGMRGKSSYELPKLPLDRKWSDDEIYQAIGLTDSEIELIDSLI
jgi:hypothetical protein